MLILVAIPLISKIMLLILLLMLIVCFVGLIYSSIDIKLFKIQQALYNNPIILKYLENKLREVSEQENILVKFLSYDEINIDVEDEKLRICGKYEYFSKNNEKAQKLLKEWWDKYEQIIKIEPSYAIQYKDKLEDMKYPRISLATHRLDDEKHKFEFYFTWIHELGHHFAETRDIENNEKNADFYTLEFVDAYLPPFYKWIYSSYIEILTDTKIKINPIKSYLQYKRWLKNHK